MKIKQKKIIITIVFIFTILVLVSFFVFSILKKNENISPNYSDGLYIKNFKSEIDIHRILLEKYFQIAEGGKIMGLISPWWVCVQLWDFGFYHVVGIHLLLWFLFLLYYKF